MLTSKTGTPKLLQKASITLAVGTGCFSLNCMIDQEGLILLEKCSSKPPSIPYGGR